MLASRDKNNNTFKKYFKLKTLMNADPVPSIREEKMGFRLQTLSYPDAFELQNLGRKGKEHLEKAVAIVIDDDNRIKRCQFSSGYIHEQRTIDGWETVAAYSDLDELETSRVYSNYLSNLPSPTAQEEEDKILDESPP